MVGAIQLSIMMGGLFGGVPLDQLSMAAPLTGGAALLALACLTVGNGDHLRPRREASRLAMLKTMFPTEPESCGTSECVNL